MVDRHGILVAKGVDPGQHFVDEHAQSPPVDRFSMSLVEQNLGRQVLGSAAEGEGPILDLLGEPEIC